ncbi:hypothetical protein [Gleimia hominis]|uniref:hypothetical protein n=1 Tax=Gleimia hominis TaxID=595468 RepID=UPI000C808F25|nr:hypothetical protein [Gleimia hominis]WIK65061.1 hypothetical protein CJ187_003135 [Gleimia hominis]
MLFTPADGVDIDLTNLTVSQNGMTEQLPVTAVDVTGAPVHVKYAKIENGLLISVSELYQTRSVGKCLAGIGGGTVTGAGTLGLGGAAVGTVTVPVIGTVSGGLLGSIVGGIGGGLTGVATFCW